MSSAGAEDWEIIPTRLDDNIIQDIVKNESAKATNDVNHYAFFTKGPTYYDYIGVGYRDTACLKEKAGVFLLQGSNVHI